MLLIVAAGALVYANSLAGVFVYDDLPAIRDNPNIRALWPPSRVFSSPPYTATGSRPLVCLTLALNYAVSGLHVWSYHAFNIALHILAGLTLFGVVRRTLPRIAPSPVPNRLPAGFALAVALIWLVHPLHTEVVSYISTRTESLMGVLLLLSLYATIRGAAAARPTMWYALAVVASALGMLSKEAMAVAPVLVLLYDRTFLTESFRRALRARWPFYAGLAATWGICAAILAAQPRATSVGFGFAHLGPWHYALTQAGVLLHYLRLTLWPHPLALCYDDWPITRSLLAASPQVAVILALLAATAWGLSRRHWLGFLGAWFFLILAPTSSFVPVVTEVVAERRMYLPLAALVVLVAATAWWALRRAGRRFAWPPTIARYVAALLTAGIVLTAGTLTVQRNRVFDSAESVWRDLWSTRPHSLAAEQGVAAALLDQGRIPEALDLLRDLVRRQPDDSDAHCNLASALEKAGRLADAAHHYAEAVRLQPGNWYARTAYAEVLVQLGRRPEAESELRESLRLEPRQPRGLRDLGRLYQLDGQAEPAIRCYTQALQLDPENGTALAWLGMARLSLGDLAGALPPLEQAVRLQPQWGEAHRSLGVWKLRSGDYPAALQCFQDALRCSPQDAESHYYLGMTLTAQGQTQAAVAALRQSRLLSPEWPQPANNLAWILATAREPTVRDPNEAVRLAEWVCGVTPNPDPTHLDTLAAAYAAAGRFDDAVRTATQALDAARRRGQTQDVSAMEARLDLYRRGQPYTEPARP